jgi:3-deoxy-D-manno-octulosonic-acid transferase
MTECELWPNLIRASARRGIPTILINGRLSVKSYTGYRKLRVFFEAVVKSMDLILVQSAQDKERFEKLGAARERVRVVGSAKYDAAGVESAGEEKARHILAGAGIDKDDLIVVGGSTWSGEEDVLCDIYKRLRGVFRPLRLVLVPRHAERRAEVEATVRKHGLSLKKRSEMSSDGEAASRRDLEGAAKAPGSGTDVLLVDSTGELTAFYACASVIFVGKSLLAHGGQNIIEPALLEKPIIVGPYMENFSAVMGDFLEANAVFQVQDAGGLEAALRSLLADDGLREEYGRRARGVVESRKGVVRESVRLITETISARQIIGSSR